MSIIANALMLHSLLIRNWKMRKESHDEHNGLMLRSGAFNNPETCLKRP